MPNKPGTWDGAKRVPRLIGWRCFSQLAGTRRAVVGRSWLAMRGAAPAEVRVSALRLRGSVVPFKFFESLTTRNEGGYPWLRLGEGAGGMPCPPRDLLSWRSSWVLAASWRGQSGRRSRHLGGLTERTGSAAISLWVLGPVEALSGRTGLMALRAQRALFVSRGNAQGGCEDCGGWLRLMG